MCDLQGPFRARDVTRGFYRQIRWCNTVACVTQCVVVAFIALDEWKPDFRPDRLEIPFHAVLSVHIGPVSVLPTSNSGQLDIEKKTLRYCRSTSDLHEVITWCAQLFTTCEGPSCSDPGKPFTPLSRLHALIPPQRAAESLHKRPAPHHTALSFRRHGLLFRSADRNVHELLHISTKNGLQ